MSALIVNLDTFAMMKIQQSARHVKLTKSQLQTDASHVLMKLLLVSQLNLSNTFHLSYSVGNTCATCGINEVVEEDETTGIRSCKACPDGEVAAENACATCDPIQFIETGEDGVRVCKDCKPNQNVIAGECKDCEAGEVRDEADPTACTACSSNEISTDDGCLACGDSELVVENAVSHIFKVKKAYKLNFSAFHVQSVNCLSTVMVKEAAFVMIQRVIMTMKENAFSAIIQMH